MKNEDHKKELCAKFYVGGKTTGAVRELARCKCPPDISHIVLDRVVARVFLVMGYIWRMFTEIDQLDQKLSGY